MSMLYCQLKVHVKQRFLALLQKSVDESPTTFVYSSNIHNHGKTISITRIECK